jgi:putative hemolysin
VNLFRISGYIEDLVGEIEDEFDRLPAHIQPVGSGWIVGGATSITIIASTLGVELSFENIHERAPNLAEWIAQKMGRDVEAGEALSFDNISITARKLRRRKLAEAFISKIQ